MIDLHAHLLPGVDDGARDEREAARALAALRDAGFSEVTATPHLDASLAEQPRRWEARLATFDAAWARLVALRDDAAPGLRVRRGVELMLDTPDVPPDDPRLRLGDGDALLVEFPRLGVPPSMPEVLERLREAGWRPVVAHPERYDVALAGGAARWRAAGAALAVNAGALTGAYGPGPERASRELFARGLADAVATDYHARGGIAAAAAAALLERSADADFARLLTVENPRRLLAGEAPVAPPAVRIADGFGDRFRRLFR